MHNPEFTILEWYRPGWDHDRLMSEIDDLLNLILGVQAAERLSYGEAFQRHVGIDPHVISDDELRRKVSEIGVDDPDGLERNDLLDLLLTHVLMPKLEGRRPTVIHDYPAAQAALARIRSGSIPIAERFEFFVDGVELANGYHELTGADEQRRRFESDLEVRRMAGLPEVPIDERLNAALDSGLPDCAGVALGVDRLVMLSAGTRKISDVIAFPIDRA